MEIKFEDVTFYYEKKRRKPSIPAIKDINLEFSDNGEFVMIVGQTGAGKSTLLSHINGLIIPSEGRVIIDDKIITNKVNSNPKLKPIRKKIGYVFQFPEYQLFDETVLKDMAYGPRNFGYSEEDAYKSAIEAAKNLKIEHLLKRSPFELSGGQMRKAAIGGIVAYDPNVYLLDEPTRGLDPVGAIEIMDFFKDLQVNKGKTMIMITHDMDIVYQYATRVIVVDGAEIKFDGKKEDLFASEYLKYGLDRPKILNIIDEINRETKRNLPHTIYTEAELLKALKDGDN